MTSECGGPGPLSYHWPNDAGETQIFEGACIQSPDGGVGLGQTVDAKLMVKAPDQAGSYILMLTKIRDKVMWLEEDERLEPPRLTVEVATPNE